MEKRKNSNKIQVNKFLYLSMIIVIIILIVLIVFFALRTIRQYSVLRNHENYFKENNLEIEPWMNIHLIEKRFNITQDNLSGELKINSSRIDQRQTLDSICKKNHLNCTEVVNDLNNLIK